MLCPEHLAHTQARQRALKFRPSPKREYAVEGPRWRPSGLCEARLCAADFVGPVAAGLGLQINADTKKRIRDIPVGAGHGVASPLHISDKSIPAEARAARLITRNPPLAFSAPR